MKKRIIAFAAAVLMIFSFAPLCFASNMHISIDDGLKKLQSQFSRDKGPLVNDYAIDYSFFSPVTDEADQTAYPLIVIMAGAREGAYEGKELTANEFANWSSREFQARFLESGGAFILIARAPEERLVNWNAFELIAPLKAAIDDFIVKHPQVDTKRIYTIGWCLGAKGAINLAGNYPGLIAAAVIMVPPFKISESDAKKLSNIPVWLFGCKNDSYASYDLYIEPTWERLVKYASNPKLRRFTSFDTAVNTTFFFNHNVWLMVSHDMNYTGNGYSGMKTINGNGEELSTEFGFINSISRYGLPEYKLETASDENCDCLCHSKNILKRLIWKVITLLDYYFYREKSVCPCGKGHFVLK